MIMGIILGIFFKENLNPFQKVEKNQKIISFLQLSLVIATISFISSFIRISMSDPFGLIFTLIFVNCPLLFILFWKKEEKIGHLIIFINSFIILGFVLHFLSLVFDPLSGGHFQERLNIFPPLSYPLMASHEEMFVSPPPGGSFDIYYYSTYLIGIILPFLSIQLPHETLSLNSDLMDYQRILEIVSFNNQFFIFLSFFILNLIFTLIILKVFSLREQKIDINRILDIACRTSILLVNIVFTAYIFAGFVAYSIYRFYGDISIMETGNFFSFVLIIIISISLILRFYRYPLFQESYQRFTKELFVIGLIGFISLFIVLITETILPHPDLYLDYSSVIVMIVAGIITILSTLLMMYKPVFTKQNINLEETSTSN